MTPFTTLNAVAAPLPLMNIDTDMIIPKQFLKTIKRTGLGVHLFDEMRYTIDGTPIADFMLNNVPWDKAEILVAGANFGCGSSREHAPWALSDFGIRCVIAPSFADIFYNNCFKNGMLPVTLPEADVSEIMDVAKRGEPVAVDLDAQSIVAAGKNYGFEIEPFRKKCLLEGLDDISLTLEQEGRIRDYEASAQDSTPWVYAA